MTDPVTRLNTALQGRYRIERQLGEGGMATVYLAKDLKHERKVALSLSASQGVGLFGFAVKIIECGIRLSTFLAFLAPCVLEAQVQSGAQAGALSQLHIDGPPAPVSPAVINRDDRGNATVRAIRLADPIRLDGQLDEAVYRDIGPITGFIQTLPDEGSLATERTEAWITFDATNVYVSARLWDSAPESDWVANEMRRDTNQLRNNDTFSASFDTYYDRRNAFNFYTNPLGARADLHFMNEGGSTNQDWNPIWDVRTGRFEGGWTVEMQIPFKSLRYRPGASQIWGVQLRRAVRRKNEWAHLTFVPQSAVRGSSGGTAIIRVSRYGTLVGLEPPPASRNLEIKPYGISGMKTDRSREPAIEQDGFADAGLDLKYGLTQNLTADFTLNTDFAQVEVDEQQVNLTRFQLFFPEKREFFLESRGVYDFASSTFTSASNSRNVPTLFFSRRIGLESGALVPVVAGGRLTGKVGPFNVGALNIQTGKEKTVGVPATNFTALRLRRDVLRRSSLGVLFTRRSASTVAEGSNETLGMDVSFSLPRDIYLAGFYAETRTRGLTGDDRSYQARVNYSGDIWGAALEHLRVGENFNPEVGFVRRRGFQETIGAARFSPRPQSIDAIRRLSFEANLTYLELVKERLVGSRQGQARFEIEFESSDLLDITYTDTYEFLDRDFPISSHVVLPPGRYSFSGFKVGLGLGLQRWYSGNFSFQRGSFYSGDKMTVGLASGRLNMSTQFSLEPSLSFNWVDLPEGSFRADVASARINYAFNPRMFLSGLAQYNSDNENFSVNFRLRWEYRPGSELFVVYTEARSTDVLNRLSELENRGLTVKLNYLLRP